VKILHVVGARPNFMKVAPICRAFSELAPTTEQVLVHTGQHYDAKMSDVFFRDLGLPDPDEYLQIGGGSHAVQTARIMMAFEPVLEKHRPDWVLVVGDVNSTVACAIDAVKLGIPVAHVEAGLRSGDMSMPEEVNRRLTDSISSLLLTPSPDADENLLREGHPSSAIRCVGNVMIDSLVRLKETAAILRVPEKLKIADRPFVLVTLHRPSNVDNEEHLRQLLVAFSEIGHERQIVFPVHPRTRQCMKNMTDLNLDNILLLEPLGYLEFLSVMMAASMVITDSGGVQEETTFLGIPCLTVRPNTERPVTITCGTNRLVEPKAVALLDAYQNTCWKRPDEYECPALWDGRTAERIVAEFGCV
jgi:UDP-N-acetylglucosamine 2-epimerase (non-hydrolysing)